MSKESVWKVKVNLRRGGVGPAAILEKEDRQRSRGSVSRRQVGPGLAGANTLSGSGVKTMLHIFRIDETM